ncbi:MAG TPA: ribosomal protein S21/MRP21, partial [Dehalococcoidia bacterium]|nr:ribosomal protein S21/MRP21 [Dehalococcoidia bacterium]
MLGYRRGFLPCFFIGFSGARYCYPYGVGSFAWETQKHNPQEWHLAVVNLREGEDPEGLLKRFQTSMQRSGILRELRNRR